MESGPSSESGEAPGLSPGVARAAPLAPVPLPDHELLRRIGKGGYGEVWLARNVMGTHRAVKIVYRRSFTDQRPFEREWSGIHKFEPISRSHEGFVDVLQAGIKKELGYFYYVMELGDDVASGQRIDPLIYSPKTLAKEISSRGKLSVQECLQLGLALSLALAELHKHGLVHRDVKPSNIIFVNGVPKLADIGLVADLNEAHTYVGTEGYIPPEGPGTPQADVYGLGKVLYEACTGKDRQDFPELPTLLDKFVERERFLELNEVLLQACKNEPAKRYSSAWDMHADLLVLANGKSVKRLKLLERRLAGLKRVASISAAALLALASVTYPIFREHKAAQELRLRQVASNLGFGNRAVETGDTPGSLPYFAEALRLDQRNAHHEKEYRLRFGSTHSQCAKIVQMWFDLGEVDSVDFSPDGRQVLAISRHDKARVFDIETGRPLSSPFGQGGTLKRGAFNADGSLVVLASEGSTACVWRVKDAANLLTLDHSNKVMSACFSPDGSRILTSCFDNVARVWDARTGQLLHELTGHTNHLRYAAFSPDGRWIVTTSEDCTARLWNATNGQAWLSPLPHTSWVMHAAFSPDGRTLATACFDRKVRFWDRETGQRILPDLNHLDGVSSVEFSPDGRLIVTAGLDRMVRLWNAESHQPIKINSILRHSDRVLQAALDCDGRRIVSACTDGTVRVWDMAGCASAPPPRQFEFSKDKSRFLTITNNVLQVWDTGSGNALSPAIHPGPFLQAAKPSREGRFVLTLSGQAENPTSARKVVEVWETQTGRRMGPSLLLTNDLADLLLEDGGRYLLTIAGNVVQTWDVPSGNTLATVTHNESVQSAVWNPAGDVIATWDGREVRVWLSATGLELFEPIQHAFPVQYVEFSPNGSRFVTCSADPGFNACQAQVWNARTAQPVGLPMRHADGILCARFSPDGTRVVTASEDFTTVVWKAETGKQLTPPMMHEDQVAMASFSPDGSWIVTASADESARVWSAETGDPLTPWLRHLAKLADAVFLTDERKIVTSDRQGNTRVWELPVDTRPWKDIVALARFLSGGSITPPGQTSFSEQETLKADWARLRREYPGDFRTTAEDIAAWHELQAAENKLENQWAAARFHLERCLKLRPGDLTLIERLSQANKNLKSAN